MPTTVHIPKALLASVDRKARALRVSRNRLIVRALDREVRAGAGWSAEFLDRLRQVDSETAADVDTLLADIMRTRLSKRPLKL